MRFRDLIEAVFGNLRRMKLRLVLTALGVVIGTSSVVLMVSLGIGLQRNITEELTGFGDATHIQVQGGGGMSGMGISTSGDIRLDDDALDEFAEIENVVAVMPRIWVPFDQMEYRRNVASTQALGVRMDDLEALGFELEKGRLAHREGEIVLGASVEEIFAGGSPWMGAESPDIEPLDLMGKRITVTTTIWPEDMTDPNVQPTTEKRQVTVVGILKEADMETDTSVFVPMDEAIDMAGLTRRGLEYSLVVIKADSPESVAAIERTVTEQGYFAFSAQSAQDAVKQTFWILQVVLGAIGGIALLVASLGIANTMTMSILERTREIGIMKAVGASGAQIRHIFLGESAVIGLLGGLGGLIFSVAGAALANLFVAGILAAETGSAEGNATIFHVPLWLAIFAVVFATTVGLLAGVLPAIRAANLDPLVALRHE
jgi:putative ABC transport system permease protein